MKLLAILAAATLTSCVSTEPTHQITCSSNEEVIFHGRVTERQIYTGFLPFNGEQIVCEVIE
jgi:hypothetical protein